MRNQFLYQFDNVLFGNVLNLKYSKSKMLRRMLLRKEEIFLDRLHVIIHIILKYTKIYWNNFE